MDHQGGNWHDGAYNTVPHTTYYSHQYDSSTLPHGETTYLHQQLQQQQPWNSNNFAFADAAYIAPEESQGLYMDGMVDSSSSQATRLANAEAEDVGEEEEAERAQEAGGGREEAKEVWSSSLEPLSDKDALKMRVGTLWKRKGLWVGMPAKEIASGFAEIKIEVGGHLNSQSGHVLANYLKLHPQSSARYMKEVKGWSRKFISRLQKLNERYDREMGRRRKGKGGRGGREDGGTRESTEEQEKRKAYLFKYIPFVQTRDQYTRLVGSEEEADKQDEGKRLHRESHNAWAALGEHFRVGRLDATTSMKQIEIESRYLSLFLSTYTMEEVANLLKFYMIETFHRTPEEIDIFNKERNQWLEQCERDKAAQGMASHGSTSRQMEESWEDLL